jgi:putative sigma-54 modulation protein
MDIQIKIKGSAGESFTITPAIRDYINKRCATLARFLEHDPAAFVVVELGKTTEKQKHGEIFSAEMHVVGKIAGRESDIYATANREDLYVAIDVVRDEVFRSITSKKSKNTSLMRRSGARVKNILKGFIWRGKGNGERSGGVDNTDDSDTGGE